MRVRLIAAIIGLLLLAYPLQRGRESLQSLFIFGVEDQANWQLTLAARRLHEAIILKKAHLNFLSLMLAAEAKRDEIMADQNITSLADKTNVTYLVNKRDTLRLLLNEI